MPEPTTGWIVVEQWEDDPDISTWHTLFPAYETAVKAIQDYFKDNDMSDLLAQSEWDEDNDQARSFVQIPDLGAFYITRVTGGTDG